MILVTFSLFIMLPSVKCMFCHEGLVNSMGRQHGTELTGNLFPDKTVFQIPNIGSWMYCARLCLFRSVCKSLVYDETTGDCTGYTVVTSGNYPLSGAQNKTYTDVVSLPKTIAGPCSNHKCGYHQVCVPEDFTGQHCTVIGQCIIQPTIPVSYSVVDIFTANTKVVFKCVPEYISVPNNEAARTSWCFGKERWTPTDFTCVEDDR